MSEDYTNYLLLAPGPVNLHPEVQRILSLPMIHHRTPEFDQILARVLKGLKLIFQTENQVFIHTSTGSGGMESLLVNTLSPGDKVLAIVSGKFGERWAEMAKVFGCEVSVVKVPWGQAVNPIEIETFLTSHPDTRAVLCQACETSTAVAHPIEDLGRMIAKLPNTLFLVDGITAVGAYQVQMDKWGIDGLVAGSHKAFMLPTGMSFVSFSEKAWSSVEKGKLPRFYFDVRREKKANDKGETLFSSPVPIIRALDYVLSEVQKNGLESLFKTIRRRAEMTRKFAPSLKLEIYAQSPSDSVTALKVPSHIDSQKIRQHLETEHKITIMGGQDEAKGKIIRIGHMGFIEDRHMLRLFDKLGQTLLHFDKNLFSENDLKKTLKDLSDWQRGHP
jgi:aspartate aminotransferase-like enzyme